MPEPGRHIELFMHTSLSCRPVDASQSSGLWSRYAIQLDSMCSYDCAPYGFLQKANSLKLLCKSMAFVMTIGAYIRFILLII
jgi:hypothetical protein